MPGSSGMSVKAQSARRAGRELERAFSGERAQMVFGRARRAKAQARGDFGARGRHARGLEVPADPVEDLLLASGERKRRDGGNHSAAGSARAGSAAPITVWICGTRIIDGKARLSTPLAMSATAPRDGVDSGRARAWNTRRRSDVPVVLAASDGQDRAIGPRRDRSVVPQCTTTRGALIMATKSKSKTTAKPAAKRAKRARRPRRNPRRRRPARSSCPTRRNSPNTRKR